MAKIIKVIDNQTIELISYRNPNICFSIEDTTYIKDEGIPGELKTNKFQDCEYYCDFKEQINPFELYSKNKEQEQEIARLNKIIEEIDRIANTNYQTNIYTGSYSFKRGYNEGSKFFQEFLRNKLKELKEEGKNE